MQALVACQSYSRQASPVAATAGKRRIQGFCCGCSVFPSQSLFSYRVPTLIFKNRGSFMNGVSPGAAVFRMGGPLKMADVAHTQGSF